MKQRIIDLCKLSNGANIRKMPDNEQNGDVYVIQYKNIDFENELLNLKNLAKISSKDLKIDPKDFLYPGDMVFTGNGNKNKAILIPENLDLPIIATHHFTIISRVNNTEVIPEYLALFINQSGKFFNMASQGSVQRNISKENLSTLEVPVPSIELQNTAATIQKLITEEKKITQQLLDNRQRLMQGIINEYITNK
jgi:restriction endonuclease S subunit